jgi:hypothetical protein
MEQLAADHLSAAVQDEQMSMADHVLIDDV